MHGIRTIIAFSLIGLLGLVGCGQPERIVIPTTQWAIYDETNEQFWVYAHPAQLLTQGDKTYIAAPLMTDETLAYRGLVRIDGKIERLWK